MLLRRGDSPNLGDGEGAMDLGESGAIDVLGEVDRVRRRRFGVEEREEDPKEW